MQLFQAYIGPVWLVRNFTDKEKISCQISVNLTDILVQFTVFPTV